MHNYNIKLTKIINYIIKTFNNIVNQLNKGQTLVLLQAIQIRF